jgi:hypothetical protein
VLEARDHFASHLSDKHCLCTHILVVQVDPNLCGDVVFEPAPSNSGVTCTKQQKQRRRLYDRKKQYINPLEAGTRWQGGKRVSTRIKSKPLEWWKGERMLYGRVHACKFYSLNPLLKLYVNLMTGRTKSTEFL